MKVAQISQACVNQRSGRAGRIRNGFCFRMYSLQQYEAMDQYTSPEIARISLTEISLKAKLVATKGKSIEKFLSGALQPPDLLNIRQSVASLMQIGVLAANESITPLGYRLANMPIDCQFGKAILFAIVMKCLVPVLTIVSFLSTSKDPFLLPINDDQIQKIEKSKKYFAGKSSVSDYELLLNIYKQWIEQYKINELDHFCTEYSINNDKMLMVHEIKQQLFAHLNNSGLIPPKNEHLNKNSKDYRFKSQNSNQETIRTTQH